MKTFDDIVKEVLRFGFNDSPQVNKARIEDWINEAQHIVARKVSAPEFQAEETLTMVPAKEKYPLPAGFLRIISIHYPELTMHLRPIKLQTFDLLSALEGPPDRYTLWKNELWLFPTPDNSDKLEIRFIKEPTELKNAGDIPTMNQNYLHVLKEYAVCRAYEAEDDAEMATAHFNRYTKDLAFYATDMQQRQEDRPKQLDGTWGGF